MYRQGERLAVGVRAAIRRHGLDGYVEALGRSCNLAAAIDAALAVYRRALDQGISSQLNGRPVKPVMRILN